MNILYTARSEKAEATQVGGRFVSLEELLRESDIVSLHVPLTGATTELINESTLALMQKHALLVNTSRGGVVDQAALL